MSFMKWWKMKQNARFWSILMMTRLKKRERWELWSFLIIVATDQLLLLFQIFEFRGKFHIYFTSKKLSLSLTYKLVSINTGWTMQPRSNIFKKSSAFSSPKNFVSNAWYFCGVESLAVARSCMTFSQIANWISIRKSSNP